MFSRKQQWRKGSDCAWAAETEAMTWIQGLLWQQTHTWYLIRCESLADKSTQYSTPRAWQLMTTPLTVYLEKTYESHQGSGVLQFLE